MTLSGGQSSVRRYLTRFVGRGRQWDNRLKGRRCGVFCRQGRAGRWAMKHAIRALLGLVATIAAVLAVTVTPSSAGGSVTPDQLSQAGWTCIQPRADPTREICAPPGVGLPPLPGTP